MNPSSRIPTAAEEENIHRKVELVRSMVGTDTDAAMTVLLYALAFRAIEDNVDPESLIANFAAIYTQVERADNVNR